MSYQTATVYLSPAYSMITNLLPRRYPTRSGYVLIDCYGSQLDMRIVKFTWDGTQWVIGGTFDAPCTGTLYEFVFIVVALGWRINSIGDIADLSIQVNEGEPYIIYLVETLTSPTTATVYIT